MRRDISIIAVSALLALALIAGCTRPKPSPTPLVAEKVVPGTTTAEASPTASPTATVSPTIEATPTEVVETPTPTPTKTATPPAPAPTETPTPTPAPTPTPTPIAGFTYTVQWGDTLFSIARRFGTTVEAIAELNKLSDPRKIRAGQQLIIPGKAPAGVIHIVQPGENLFRIALRYGTTVEAIAEANGIVNPRLILVGQKLIIPGATAAPGRIHIVQPGENLFRIALRYGTTPQAIAVANNLPNINLIYVGQRLRIP